MTVLCKVIGESSPAPFNLAACFHTRAFAGFEYAPLGCQASCPRFAFRGDSEPDDEEPKKKQSRKQQEAAAKTAAERAKRAEHAIGKEKAKALADLLDQVRRDGQPADGKWYQDFRLEVAEGGQLRIDPEELAIVLRVHQLFEVLAGARRILLDSARQYADVVFAEASQQPML